MKIIRTYLKVFCSVAVNTLYGAFPVSSTEYGEFTSRVAINGKLLQGVNCHLFPKHTVTEECRDDCLENHFLQLTVRCSDRLDDRILAFQSELMQVPEELTAGYDMMYSSDFRLVFQQGWGWTFHCSAPKRPTMEVTLMLNGVILPPPYRTTRIGIFKHETVDQLKQRLPTVLENCRQVIAYKEEYEKRFIQSVFLTLRPGPGTPFCALRNDVLMESVLKQGNHPLPQFFVSCVLVRKGVELFKDNLEEDERFPAHGLDVDEDAAAKAAYIANKLFEMTLSPRP